MFLPFRRICIRYFCYSNGNSIREYHGGEGFFQKINKRNIYIYIFFLFFFFSFLQNVCIYIFPAHVSPRTISPAVIARNLPRNFDSEYEYVDFTQLAPPARDNLESLPQTATTLCIRAACQRCRPPFELEILIWKSNRPGTRLRGGVGIVLPPFGVGQDLSLRSRLLKTSRRAAASIREITHPPLRAIGFVSHFRRNYTRRNHRSLSVFHSFLELFLANPWRIINKCTSIIDIDR